MWVPLGAAEGMGPFVFHPCQRSRDFAERGAVPEVQSRGHHISTAWPLILLRCVLQHKMVNILTAEVATTVTALWAEEFPSVG